jgi:hypothetical protein
VAILLSAEKGFAWETGWGRGTVLGWTPPRMVAADFTPGRGVSPYLTLSSAFEASSRRKGMTAGISHFSHISSTLAWK